MQKPMRQYFVDEEMIDTYCLGLLPAGQAHHVSLAAHQHPFVQKRVNETLNALWQYAAPPQFEPEQADFDQLLARIQTLAQQPPIDLAAPPHLDHRADLLRWQQAVAPIQAPVDFSNAFVYPLYEDDQVRQLLVWVRQEISAETHFQEQERIFILTGHCEGLVGGRVVQLSPGDYLTIAPHTEHSLRVTSGPVQLLVQQDKAV